MNQIVRGSRNKVKKQANEHINTLFQVYKTNHTATPTYSQEMLSACRFYGLTTSDNTAIFFTILGIYARVEALEQIKNRQTFNRFKRQYSKKINKLNPAYKVFRVFEECNNSPVTYDNSHISKAMFNGFVPDIELNCGESLDQTYNKYFKLEHFKGKLNGNEIELHFYELVQYLTGCILPFKTIKSFTIKSSWINQEYCRETPATLYLVLLTKQNGERFYKIGITKGVMISRLRQIPYNSKVIIKHKCSLLSAIWYEHKLHKMNKPYSYAPKISFSGEEECYHKVSKDSFREVLGHA